MLRHYTAAELLAMWKRRKGLAASPVFCGNADLTQFDAMITARLESAYATLLRTADAGLLPCEDLADQCTAEYTSDNSAQISWPARGVRPLAVRLDEWQFPLREFISPQSLRALCQRLPESSATVLDPVAVLYERSIEVFGLCESQVMPIASMPAYRPTPQLAQMLMVCAPQSGFELDNSLIDRLFTLTDP